MITIVESHTRDLTRFYKLLAKLESLPHQGAALSTVIASASLPQRGVYFFREVGELLAPTISSSIGLPRITRVGTHAVTAGSKATLRSRLKAHLGPKSGIGNHRGSIFRLHVGNALLRQEMQSLETWGVGSSPPQALRDSEIAKAAEAALERRVSLRISEMQVLWVDVPDEASPSSERSTIERGAIALLSNRLSPLSAPSADWLGLSSNRDEIKRSGLWNLRHVEDCISPAFFDALEHAVQRTVSAQNRLPY